NNMCLNIFHDENYDLYINGILASSGKGFTTNYVIAPLSDTGKAALKPNAINTIAIKCSQTIGGQFIDTGMMIFQIINNSK
ncbi:MAG: hypothetical protein JXM68_11245, partial [Sedimentisphaerales bacterium]|nr:hypothetical protein [Sedimentisphaerales bacterium]